MVFCANKGKENIFEKGTKLFFSNRDVILYYFCINLNITYSTKSIKSDIPECMIFQNNYIFSYFLEYVGNDLKIDQWPVFQYPDVRR